MPDADESYDDHEAQVQRWAEQLMGDGKDRPADMPVMSEEERARRRAALKIELDKTLQQFEEMRAQGRQSKRNPAQVFIDDVKGAWDDIAKEPGGDVMVQGLKVVVPFLAYATVVLGWSVHSTVKALPLIFNAPHAWQRAFFAGHAMFTAGMIGRGLTLPGERKKYETPEQRKKREAEAADLTPKFVGLLVLHLVTLVMRAQARNEGTAKGLRNATVYGAFSLISRAVLKRYLPVLHKAADEMTKAAEEAKAQVRK